MNREEGRGEKKAEEKSMGAHEENSCKSCDQVTTVKS